jgi:hypothetical protein
MHAHKTKALVDAAIVEWETNHFGSVLSCYIADVSDQSGEMWDALVEWLVAEGRPAGQLMLSGVGPLLWLQSGHVILYVAAPLEHSSSQLAAVTESVFTSAD